jgi:hypothetical protein
MNVLKSSIPENMIKNLNPCMNSPFQQSFYAPLSSKGFENVPPLFKISAACFLPGHHSPALPALSFPINKILTFLFGLFILTQIFLSDLADSPGKNGLQANPPASGGRSGIARGNYHVKIDNTPITNRFPDRLL